MSARSRIKQASQSIDIFVSKHKIFLLSSILGPGGGLYIQYRTEGEKNQSGSQMRKEREKHRKSQIEP
nr:MAG TPA: hypothetical protein [Caudoviricetes sp.]